MAERKPQDKLAKENYKGRYLLVIRIISMHYLGYHLHIGHLIVESHPFKILVSQD